MENYDNFKEDWKNQKATIKPEEEVVKITGKIGALRKKQHIANSILVLTVVIVLGYLLYVIRFGIGQFNLGLLLMIGVLVFRIILEARDRKRLATIDPSMPTEAFRKRVAGYYKWRLTLHRVITPICFLCYAYGFTLLLPTFKDIFSKGFYNYLLFSGIGSLVVIALIVIVQTKKELRELKSMQ